MTDSLRVILEIGKKKRVVAGAMDWPGLDRWGTAEDGAIDAMVSYRPRYAGVVERAGMAKAFAKAGDPEVVERVPGVGSTEVRTPIDVSFAPPSLPHIGKRSSPRSAPTTRRARRHGPGRSSSSSAGWLTT
jgi:hypothetical protein